MFALMAHCGQCSLMKDDCEDDHCNRSSGSTAVMVKKKKIAFLSKALEKNNERWTQRQWSCWLYVERWSSSSPSSSSSSSPTSGKSWKRKLVVRTPVTAPVCCLRIFESSELRISSHTRAFLIHSFVPPFPSSLINSFSLDDIFPGSMSTTLVIVSLCLPLHPVLWSLLLPGHEKSSQTTLSVVFWFLFFSLSTLRLWPSFDSCICNCFFIQPTIHSTLSPMIITHTRTLAHKHTHAEADGQK